MAEENESMDAYQEHNEAGNVKQKHRNNDEGPGLPSAWYIPGIRGPEDRPHFSPENQALIDEFKDVTGKRFYEFVVKCAIKNGVPIEGKIHLQTNANEAELKRSSNEVDRLS